MEKQRVTKWSMLFGISAIYFIAGKVGLRLAYAHPSISAVWPPTGIAFAIFLLLGYRCWPAILVGAFLVNLTTAGNLVSSFGIATGNTLEGLVGAYLVNRYANGRRVFERPQDIFRFVLYAGMLSTMISATLGVTSLSFTGYAIWSRFRTLWLTWWLGDFTGNLIVAPLLVLWFTESFTHWSREKRWEIILMLFTLWVTGLVVFGGYFPTRVKDYPLEFMTLPLVVWAAFRFHPKEVTGVTTLLSCIALWGTVHGTGPFARTSVNASLILLQTYMGLTSILGCVMACMIQQNVQAEERLKQTAAELKRTNKDLEDFVYSVSHDLQEPLRKIASYTDLLMQRYKNQIGPEADKFITHIVDGAVRMQRLISDLLAYSRMNSIAPVAEPTNMTLVLRQAMENLEKAIQESGATITYEELPIIMAHPLRMGEVFQNLIGNAIKFRGTETPRVHISARRESSEWQFSVQDNGIGIDPKYDERIFVIFERLHTHQEHPGAGIGLAICKKAVESYGGRIWVKSNLGQGSTFFFTILDPLRSEPLSSSHEIETKISPYAETPL